jgi:hypothetical protein
MTIPSFKTLIHPDLAAFTAHSVPDATQDAASDLLTEGWFELWRKLGDGGEEGGVTGLVIKPPEPPRWSVTP